MDSSSKRKNFTWHTNTMFLLLLWRMKGWDNQEKEIMYLSVLFGSVLSSHPTKNHKCQMSSMDVAEYKPFFDHIINHMIQKYGFFSWKIWWSFFSFWGLRCIWKELNPLKCNVFYEVTNLFLNAVVLFHSSYWSERQSLRTRDWFSMYSQVTLPVPIEVESDQMRVKCWLWHFISLLTWITASFLNISNILKTLPSIENFPSLSWNWSAVI